MTGSTEINPLLDNDKTVINSQLVPASGTMVNPVLVSMLRFQNNAVLNGKYKVINQLNTETGEADLYICECNDKQYIAKVYRRDRSNKNELTELLQNINCPYIAPVIDIFEVGGLQVEILPYYRKGSLAGTVLDEKILKTKVIPDLIEGLKVLHKNGVVHKDIKPSNIMWAENGEDVVIIDFGISSLLNGNTLVKTQTGFTLEYTAPEALKGLFLPLSDYYSLGITIYELLYGKTPYKDLKREELEEYFSIQNIPLPDKISEDFRDLLRGLTYHDIRNRNDADNPNCRWGYEKVKCWCEGVKQVVPGTGFGGVFGDMPQYRFRGETFFTRETLARALASRWEEGKAELFRGNLERSFKAFDLKTAQRLAEYETEYLEHPEEDDNIFWKALYDINAGTYEIYWKNVVFKDLDELGHFILDGYRENKFESKRSIEDIITQKIVSRYIRTVAPDNGELIEAVITIEKRFAEADNGRKKAEIQMLNGYVLGFMISKEKRFLVGKELFSSIYELTNHILKLRSQSEERFEEFCRILINKDNELAPQFEAWLIACGKQEVIHQWKKLLVQ